MNQLTFGFSRKKKIDISAFLENDILYIGAHPPPIPDWKSPARFNTTSGHLNLFKDIDYRTRCDYIDIFDALFPRGDGTLTKDTGLEYIAERLDENPRSLHELIPVPDKSSTTGHIWAYNRIRRLLRSPVLTRALSDTSKTINGRVVLAELDRGKMHDFDIRALAWFLISNSKGQICIEDLNFIGRDFHVRLLTEDRLAAHIRSLEPLRRKAPDLYDEVISYFASLSIDEQYDAVSGLLYDDAVVLARQAGLRPDPDRADNDYNQFIDHAMQ